MFDRVHRGFLQAVLLKFGITGWLQTAIMSLYSAPSARVLTSGVLSEPFDITNGTRQDCPLSPIIFALLIEPLATRIRAEPLISGIPYYGTEHKISLFTDNIISMLSNPAQSFYTICSILNHYAAVSYYKLKETMSSILNLHTPPETQNTRQAPI